MALTPAEQYLIELVNRARLDPYAEAERYGVDLNAGLASNAISTDAKQVVAPNLLLETAAQRHSEWMLANDVFDHTGVNGSNPGARITDAGYQLTGSWTWRENLAWTGTTGAIETAQAIEDHHEGLYRSAGHRVNTFAADIKEVGIAQVTGPFTYQGASYNSSMLTLNFAASGASVYITGVAYRDSDGDDFYGVGEGVSGIWIAADGDRADVGTAGGYGLAVSTDAETAVTVGSGNTVLSELRVDLSTQNAKLDVVTDTDGDTYLALSASATLVSGIKDAQLLGVDDLSLTGNNAANVLIGNKGDNELSGVGGNDDLIGGQGADALFGGHGDDMLTGGSGRLLNWSDLDGETAVKGNDDTLLGETGNDALFGQSGKDVLDGGAGDDVLTGGSGRDTFIFNAGRDSITDFADNVDTIQLDSASLGLAGMDVADVIAMGQITGGNAVFDFGDGNVLTLEDESDLTMLSNDLVIL